MSVNRNVTVPPGRVTALPYKGEPSRDRDEPVPPPARAEPGRLVPVGRRGARPRARGGQADPALDRLRRLPLVPRDGARVVRGRANRRADERALRLDQGRPRGAARPRRDLHGRHRRDDRAGRLAADRLPDARRRAVSRRDLLPARAAPRAALVPAGAPRRLGALPGAARRRHAPDAGARGRAAAGGRGRAVGRAADGIAPLPGRAPARGAARPGVGRLRARAEVPAGVGAGAVAAARRRRACGEDARRDGGRRHVRPRRWRLPSLLGRRALARAALREDALRQRAARSGVPARLARDRQGALPRGRRGDGRVPAPRAAPAGRGVRVFAGRGHRRRRGPDVHLGAGRGRARGAVRAVRGRAVHPARRARSGASARGCWRSAPRARSPGSTTRRSRRGTASRWPRWRRLGGGSRGPTGSTRRARSPSSCSARFRRTAACTAAAAPAARAGPATSTTTQTSRTGSTSCTSRLASCAGSRKRGALRSWRSSSSATRNAAASSSRPPTASS